MSDWNELKQIINNNNSSPYSHQHLAASAKSLGQIERKYEALQVLGDSCCGAEVGRCER